MWQSGVLKSVTEAFNLLKAVVPFSADRKFQTTMEAELRDKCEELMRRIVHLRSCL